MEMMFSDSGCQRVFQNYKKVKLTPVAAPIYYDIINEKCGQMYKGRKTLVTDPEARKRIDGLFENYVGKTLAGLQKTEMLKHYFNQLISEGKDLIL